MNLSDIWIRDPFIISGNGKYYLFGTTEKPPLGESPYAKYPAFSFDCYESDSLIGKWRGPIRAFEKSSDFPYSTQFWAPEVIQYGDEYYMTATFFGTEKSGGRDCMILKSNSITGPYLPFSTSITPKSWFCLDGHIYVDNNTQQTYLIFCREWIEVNDGQIWVMKIERDLSKPIDSPTLLFSASHALWTRPIDEKGTNFVTDGPFLYLSSISKELLMIWSSIGREHNYCIGVSRSKSGSVLGPWLHDTEPIFSSDGGHAMFFRPFNACEPLWNGKEEPPLLILFHFPNKDPLQSRANIFKIEETIVNDELQLRIDTAKFIK